jgi:ATP-binding cassette subfamily B multidrug efflux pump
MLMNIANIAIYMVSMHFISQGNLQLGQLMAFLDYLFHAMISMLLFCSIFMMYPRANVSANRIKEVLHQEIHIQNPSDGKVLEDIEKVAFEHVSFTYEDGEVVLDDISFEAYKGQKVAFLGATGCGKSTLVKLLPRLYDVSSGAIYINDVDVREYDIPSLRQKIGFASQKAVLFSGTVADNVIFGEAGASKADLEKALKQAYAYDFVMDKEGQYEAEVYEGGTNFSGGQKQRLSIARTLIKKAPLYIFDDTFSALDFQSDAKIQKELRKVQNQRLTFVVAQRIASVLDADKIIVLDQGKIVDQGSHSELLKRCALYKEIALTQLSEEELYASI